MRHWTRRMGLLVAIVTAVFTVVTTSPASATANAFARPSDCPAGHSCYYDGQNGVGLLWIAPSCGFFDLGKMSPPKNDRIESIYNGGGAPLQPFNWTGSWQPVGPAIGVNLGVNYGGGFANIIDAIQVCS